MPTGWIVSNVALWVVVIFETVLLLQLLRVLGQLKQQGELTYAYSVQAPETDGLEIGHEAPPLRATNYEGSIVQLEHFRGQRCVLAFVLPGCPACAKAIETLNTVLHQEKDIRLFVVGGADAVQNRIYAKERKAQMPILTPASSSEENSYRVRTVPFIFVIDEEGIIRAKGVVSTLDRLHTLLATVPATV